MPYKDPVKRRVKGRGYSAKYRVKHRGKYLQTCKNVNKKRKPKMKAYRNGLKLKVINHYGGKCDCCKEKRIEFLCLDHKDGGGNEHRRTILKNKSHGHALYRWIIKNGYPKMFRVLCCNCNQSIGLFGYCPHKR